MKKKLKNPKDPKNKIQRKFRAIILPNGQIIASRPLAMDEYLKWNVSLLRKSPHLKDKESNAAEFQNWVPFKLL